jgi:nicotinamidase-related amidase
MTGNKTALLVIDVQRDLFAKSTPIYLAQGLLANINRLVERAHSAGAPVVFVQHGNDKTLLEGSEGWQLHQALHPAATDTMVRKTHGNAFEETPLDSLLKERGVTGVVICGLVTHGCVKATCLGALELGYRATLASDVHSSYSKDAARLIEEWNGKLGQAGARVAASADVAF